MHDEDNQSEKGKAPGKSPTRPRKKISRKTLRIGCFFLAFVVASVALYVTYIYMASPVAIRKPAFQHYHFRMQIVAKGKPVDFSQEKFQIPAGKDICSADLTERPIHFHDRKNQMVHIHWDGITGGLVLKNFGWDYIGGVNGVLGYRFDDLPGLKKVPAMGSLLPILGKDAELYVYTGDEHGYKERPSEDFLKKDLEDFFNKQSNVRSDEKQSSILDRLFPKAYAHSGEHEEHDDDSELQELNNLIGNVVIFAQRDRPSPEQIKNRFNKLEPLSDSICGG